jgi:hypothetical protein
MAETPQADIDALIYVLKWFAHRDDKPSWVRSDRLVKAVQKKLALGRPWTARYLAQVARAAKGAILSLKQKGYKATDAATAEEVNYSATQLATEAKSLSQRSTEIWSYFHGRQQQREKAAKREAQEQPTLL